MINSKMLLLASSMLYLVVGNTAMSLVVGVPTTSMSPTAGAANGAEAEVGQMLEAMSGAQFVKAYDPIMEFNLSRIINSKQFNLLPSAEQVSARQYLRNLDQLTSGKVSALFAKYFPKAQLSGGRVRRDSLDTLSGLSLGYAKKSLDPMNGMGFGSPSKRGYNFDEMDRVGFSGFAKRANEFDELDRSGFSGFAKRMAMSGGGGGAGGNFDEMDRTGFSGFAKRNNEFDEMDRTGFSGFAKRGGEFDELDRSGFSGFAKRMNFDELDHSGFSGFAFKRPKFFYPVYGSQRLSQGPKFRPFRG